MELDYPDKDGVTLRDRLTQVYESTGIIDEKLNEPEVPAQVAHLLAWFWELRNATGGGGFGPSPISFSEIKFWSELTKNYPSPWEIQMIRRMDIEYMNFCAEMDRKRTKEQQQAQSCFTKRA